MPHDGASPLGELPAPLARAIRRASVPMAIRAVFAHLPDPIVLAAEVPDDPARVDLVALQLLKLASLPGQLVLSRLTPGPSDVRLSVTLGDVTVVLDRATLDGDLASVVRRIFDGLLDGRTLSRTLEAFAAESARLSTLQHLTAEMLRSTTIDHALHVMLTAVTSGQGLGFHRAALFVWDAARSCFVGSKAIGPYDADEAHRIWEAIEYDDIPLSSLVDDRAAQNVDGRLEAFVCTLSLSPEAQGDDEVAAAMASSTPEIFRRATPVSAGLLPLIARGAPRSDAHAEFVLAAIRPHGELRGLLFADNAFGGGSPARDRVDALGLFLEQLALVWSNLTLLQQVEQLARVDGLTGVGNRRTFDEQLAVVTARCREAALACSLLVIDVDRFKEINDHGGHAAGDEVLSKLGSLLRDGIRDGDVVGRLGGDEFGVLLPSASLDDARAAAHRLGTAARKAGISLSIGGATLAEAGDGSRLAALADARLYAAKREGRGRACVGEGAGEAI